MSLTDREIDLEKLPEEARQELIDFYEFLIEKYGKKSKGKAWQNLEKEILADQIQIDTRAWKFKREEIYES